MNKRRTGIAKKQYLMAVAAIFLIVLIIFGVTRAFRHLTQIKRVAQLLHRSVLLLIQHQ